MQRKLNPPALRTPPFFKGGEDFVDQLNGTVFQKRVWRALLQIPCGTTLTYSDLAKKLKSHPRAIGQACRTNPLPLIIPCHRVVAKNSLGGYSGATSGKKLAFKRQLLEREKTLSY